MADAPVPIGQPGHVPPSGPAEGQDQTKTNPAAKPPAQVASQIDTATLKAAFDALQSTITGIGTVMAKVSKTIKQTEGASSSFTKRLTKGNRELLHDIGLIDDSATGIAEKFQKLSEFQKKMAREMATGGVKSNKQGTDLLKTLKAQLELMLQQRGVSKEQTANTKTQLANITEMLEALEKAGDNPIDTKQFADIASFVGKAAKSGEDMGKALKNIKLTHLEKDVKGVHDSIMNLFGKSDSKLGRRMEALRTIGSKGTAIREARVQRNIDRGREHDSENVGVITAKLKELGIDSSDRAGVEGVARKHGFGYLGAKAFAQKKAEGDSAGFVTNLGDRLLTKGKGSLIRGALGEVAEAGEGIAAGAAEVAGGSLALPLAAVGALIAGFAENNKLNSDIDKKLGRGGQYAGANNPMQSLRNVKENLNSGGMYNRLGIGYDKNLEIANALSEAGFSSKNLGASVVGSDKDGFMRNSFGSIQRDVYSYGRVAGLDSTATMAATIKLITQYKQSLNATETFFVQINRDAAAANITTTQYISLIDEVNSQYERSNKLLLVTTDTMRVLGLTGMHTAEDLKENMGLITNKGKERTVEQMTMLLMHTLNTPGAGEALKGAADSTRSDAIQGVMDSLGSKDENGKITAFTDERGVTYDQTKIGDMLNSKGGLSDLKNVIQHRFKNDNLGGSTANATADAAFQATVVQKATANYLDPSTGSAAERSLNLAQFMHANGDNQTIQKALSDSALDTIMKQGKNGVAYTTADLSDPKKLAEMQANLAATGFSEVLGGDKDPFGRRAGMLHDTAYAMTEVAKKGMNGEPEDTPEGIKLKAQLEQMAHSLGIVAKPGQSLIQAQQEYLSDQGRQDKAVTNLSQMDSTQHEMHQVDSIGGRALRVHDAAQAKRDAESKAVDLVSDTRSPIEMLETFLKFWLVKIIAPLDFLAKVLGHIPGITAFASGSGPGGAADQAKLSELNDQIAGFQKDTPEHPLTDEQKDQLADLQSQASLLQKVVDGTADLSNGENKQRYDKIKGDAGDGHDNTGPGLEKLSSIGDGLPSGGFGSAFSPAMILARIAAAGLRATDTIDGGIGGSVGTDGKSGACCVTNNYYTNTYNSVAATTVTGPSRIPLNKAGETPPKRSKGSTSTG